MPSPPRFRTSIHSIGRYLAVLVLGCILTLFTLYRLPPRAVPAAFKVVNAAEKPSSDTIAVPHQSSVLLGRSSDLPPVAQVPSELSPSRLDQNFVSKAVQRVGPAVVRLDTERVVSGRGFSSPFADDPFFRQFFGDAFPQGPREFTEQGQGSGFIVDGSGIVLTNAHVVSDADTVTVTLRDGRTFDGEVKGADDSA